jgi:glycosyltransferase involved in cell wall biosynthesis
LSFVNFLAKFFLSFKSIRRSKPGDLIVVLDNTFMGICCGLLSKWFAPGRDILLVNMIDHGGSKNFRKLKKRIYHPAFTKIFATVNSADLIEYYSEEYRIPQNRLFELPDTFAGLEGEIDNILKIVHPPKYDVFCGGSSHRDWGLFLEVAKAFPDKKFVGIARRKQLDQELNLPSNVGFYFDVDYALFITTMQQSAVCLLPLQTKSQAGQIVILQAGLLKKPVVITETVAIKKYIRHNENGLLVPIADKENIVAELNRLFSDAELCERLGSALNEDVKKYSQEEFAAELNLIIDKVMGSERSQSSN